MKSYQQQKIVLIQLVTFLMSMLFASFSFADYILSAPPRETHEKGEMFYGPIAKGLSKLIGEKVKYEQPRNWFDYGIKMRGGVYDVVFDGPHFAAWRMENVKHIPVATLPGKLKFILFTDKNNEMMNDLADLSEKIMCGMLAPNLATNMIMWEFPDPETQPMVFESGGFSKVYNNFKEGSCHAAVLRDKAFYKLSRDDKSSIKIIYTTAALPNQTVTIGPKLQKYAKKIANYLTSGDGARSGKNLLLRFSKKNPKFIQTSADQYVGLEKFLKGSGSGW